MGPFQFAVALDPSSRSPLFVQIARAIASDVARGRLAPGDPLPGTRTLAQTLRVHRSTVVAAYAELAAQGWIETRPGGRTLVAASCPEPQHAPRSAFPAARGPKPCGFAVAPMPVLIPLGDTLPRGTIRLASGLPDLRLTPVDLLARAYRRAAHQGRHALLGYGLDPRGHPRLRRALASMVSSARAIPATAEDVMVTRGSQMALDLLTRALVRPGDVLAVEALGYTSAFQVFRRAQADVVPIAVDAQGLDVEALGALVARRPVRLVYVTPHHQFPTTVTMSPTRRLALLDLAHRARFAIVEDDYDQEFHYDGRPVLPMASHDRAGNVIYVGTLAKILAPGLRLGFVVAPIPVLARMAAERALVDRQGDAVLECAVADLLEEGDVQRHVRRVRRVYHARRDALCDALDRHFAGVLTYRRPAGGLAIWAEVAPRFDVDRWHARALARGVSFHKGQQFTFDEQATPFVRLGYAALDDRTLELAMKRLKKSLPRG